MTFVNSTKTILILSKPKNVIASFFVPLFSMTKPCSGSKNRNRN